MIASNRSVLTLSDSISWQVEKSKGFVYILDEKKQCYYLLDEVAKDIWLLVVNGMSRDEILQKMLSLYDTDFETMKNDIDAFVESLMLSDLLIHN